MVSETSRYPEAQSLTDGVIGLRPMTGDDAVAHLAQEDEETVRWLSGGASTPESVRAWIARAADSWAAGGPVFLFAIVIAATGATIGMVEANYAIPRVQPDGVNISYGLGPEARGHGHATRAVLLLLRFLSERAIPERRIRRSSLLTLAINAPFGSRCVRASQNSARSPTTRARSWLSTAGTSRWPSIAETLCTRASSRLG